MWSAVTKCQDIRGISNDYSYEFIDIYVRVEQSTTNILFGTVYTNITYGTSNSNSIR